MSSDPPENQGEADQSQHSAVSTTAGHASQAKPDGDGDTEATPKSKPSVCGVCNVNPPRYKCPRCYLPYCSVACNKVHRDNHPPDAEPQPQPASAPIRTNSHDPPPVPSTEANDPTNPFRALETSDKLRLLFQKYPSLPNQLLQIHAATLPPKETVDPTRAAIPASLLKGLPPKKGTWNHDIGIQNGKEALRKARRADGEAGEAIREYSELILHLTNTDNSGTDVAKLLREQLAQEDTKLIERLMAEEKR